LQGAYVQKPQASFFLLKKFFFLVRSLIEEQKYHFTSAASLSTTAGMYSAAVSLSSSMTTTTKVNPHNNSAAADVMVAVSRGGVATAWESAYIVGAEVGRGSCSVVHEAISRSTGAVCVVKVMQPLPAVAVSEPHPFAAHSDGTLDTQQDQHNPEEADVLMSLSHPCIVRGIAAYPRSTSHSSSDGAAADLGSTPSSSSVGCSRSSLAAAAIVMEDLRGGGGEVFQRVSRGPLSERLAARCMWDILRALRYLHDDVGVVHRDIKLENLMFAGRRSVAATGEAPHASFPISTTFSAALSHHDNKEVTDDMVALSFGPDDVVVKLIDFGFCKRIGRGKGVRVLSSCCGSPNYMSPEMLRASRAQESTLPTKHQPYGNEVDVWAAGVCMYVMLCGSYPFYHERRASWHKSILLGQFHPFPSTVQVSALGADLLGKLLVVRPDERMSAEEALQHPWFCAMLGDRFKFATAGSAVAMSATPMKKTPPFSAAVPAAVGGYSSCGNSAAVTGSLFTPPHNHHTLDSAAASPLMGLTPLPGGSASSAAAAAAMYGGGMMMRQPEL